MHKLVFGIAAGVLIIASAALLWLVLMPQGEGGPRIDQEAKLDNAYETANHAEHRVSAESTAGATEHIRPTLPQRQRRVSAAPPSSSAYEKQAASSLEEALGSELRDATWAREKAAEIEAAIGEHPVALKDIECGRRLCRVELSFQDPEGREPIIDQLASTAAFRTHVLYFRPESKPDRLVAYMARRGERLPGR
jgi:hypothetical protein